ncbi:cTAGE family member 5 isoform X2 [Mastacembelus armatus]|uniref:cTAGE family member 5 isoform X2 n=1 Tax=Mastacembelus armatus TaxID=205130 RepID=UPI000E45A704|nr:melanoma inhibitory activity protein 2 isoform X2 [Mastacembelus armatus]
MAFSQACKFLWITCTAFVTLPHQNLGLLSDYKICGDSECESPMSRVQAIRDHHGKDCRFLSFRQGDTIFVYHKLTGKREDLWAGTIDKQFGYFPKDAVQEEQVYAAMEKVVETQKSDFFCMDDFGYLIDTSHLDRDHDDDQKILNQEPKTTQSSLRTDASSTESPLTHADRPTESLVSTQQPDGTSTEESENKNAADPADRTHEEQHKTSTAQNEQGGSPSSSWLGSSVTGWLGLGNEEQPAKWAEGEKTDERKETQAGASLSLSVTGLLGFGGGEGKPDDPINTREENKETDDSLTSTVTGWLGFGGEKNTDSIKIHEPREMAEESEVIEKFRSRRISLDLEGTQLQEDEKEDMGTLDWLGNGLSSVLRFDTTNQGLGHETNGRETEEAMEEKEQPTASSWLNIGIGDILGFRKDKSEGDESTGVGYEGKEKGTTLEPPISTENVDTSHSQHAQTEEEKREPEEKVETETVPEVGSEIISSSFNTYTAETNVEDQVPNSEAKEDSTTLAPVKVDTNNNNIDASHNSKDFVLPVHAASKVDEKDVSPQIRSEEVSHLLGGPELTGNVGEYNNKESDVEIKDATDINQDFYTQSDISLGSDLYSVDSESVGQSVGKVEEENNDQLQSKKTQSADEEGGQITNQEESTVVSAANGASDNGPFHKKIKTDVLHREMPTTHMSESAGQSQVGGNAEDNSRKTEPSLSSATAKDRNEPNSNEDDSLIVNVDNSDIPVMINNNSETETHHAEIAVNTGAHSIESNPQDFGSPHSTDSLYENAPQEDTLTQDTSADSTDQDSASLQMEPRITRKHDVADRLTEPETNTRKNLQQAQTETETHGLEKEVLNETNQKSSIETEQVKGLKEDEKLEELKEVEETEEGDRQQKIDEGKQEELVETMEEVLQEDVDGFKAGERQEDVEELTEEEKGKEVEEIKEKQAKTKELQKEENWGEMEEFKGEKELVEMEESKEVKKQEKLKEVEELEEKEKEEGEERESESSDLDVQTETTHDTVKPESESNEKETQDENTNTEKMQTEHEKMEEKETNQETVEEVKEGKWVEEMQQVNNMEREKMDKREEEKCLYESCPQAEAESESARDRNEIISEEKTQNDEIIADKIGESQMILSEGMERDAVQEEEEEKTANASTSNAMNEDISSKKTSGISDLNSLEGEQIGATKYTDSPLQLTGDSGHSGISDEVLLGHTAENKEHDLSSSEERNRLCQGHKMELEDHDMKCATSASGISTEKLTNQIHSEDKIGGLSLTSDSDESPTGPTVPSGLLENESEGAFGLFKNALNFFSQTPIPETNESTEAAPSLDASTGETTKPQASLTTKQGLDSATNFQKDFSITMPPQQHTQPSPPLARTYSHLDTSSSNTESTLQTTTLSKHYKNLLVHMSLDEMTILTELLGRHKLQFLDYILSSSETMAEDPDNDESILSDIERLVHHHRETLVAPSMRLSDAPQEAKEKTRALIALQKLDMLLGRVRETLLTGNPDVSKANHQAEAGCVGASCSTHSNDKGVTTERGTRKTQESSVSQEHSILRDEWMAMEKDNEQHSVITVKESKTEDEKKGEKRIKEESESNSHIQPQPGSPQPLEGVMKQILHIVHQISEDSAAHVHEARGLIVWITVKVVSLLPDDIRPGPDLYGVPWEPVIISSLVGLVIILLFTCRCYSSVKSRMYRSKERWMAEHVAQLLDEKCKVLQTLSKCQQEYDDLEDSLKDNGVLAQTQRTEHLEGKARQLERAKRELESDLEQLKDQLEQQREHRTEQEKRIAVLEENLKTFEEETKDLQSQEEQAQTTLKVYSMNSDRLQRNLETAGEKNTLLQESNAQLRQQVEGWAERVSELEAEMQRCEIAYSGMQQDVANKDERIKSLTDRLLRMKAWDSDLEEEANEKGGEKERIDENGRGNVTDTQGHLQKVQKLIYAAKLNADLKSLDEDKDRVFAKLNDEVKAKDDLQVSIEELEKEKLSLQSDAEHYSDQVQRLQQKLQIMTEMYQENELKLHRLLTVEEKERLQKEEKLNKADKNIALAMEELNNYRQRAEEMEDELEKTKQSYQTQISAHEKKAHNNWLAARAAERELADIRRENALLRQKLTDTQFKVDTLDKDPYALDSLARPLPFRAERSSYGPSPLGRPASETRAFLSPPTLMDGPPARLSPRGYMFPEPGGPMYRRPPPLPGPIGVLPPLGSLPPGPLLPHPRGFPAVAPAGPPRPIDIPDGSYRENSFGPGEQQHRESGPGDRRTPPEADSRIGGPPPPGPPVGPMDGPFPRRPPYGAPPPEFYPSRGPGGPPMMPMWAAPSAGMMFPPRLPPGGPSLPPAPRHHYSPSMRPPPPDGLPPPSMGPPPIRPSLPSPPHSQSAEEHTPSPEDAI